MKSNPHIQSLAAHALKTLPDSIRERRALLESVRSVSVAGNDVRAEAALQLHLLRQMEKRQIGKGRDKKVGRKTTSRRSVLFPGLINDAVDLGVHRNALYLALSGKRTDKRSKEILAAYHRLKGTHNGDGNGKDGR